MTTDRRRREELVAEVVKSLAASLRNRALYPPNHPLVRTPIEKCYSALLPLFAGQKEVALLIADKTLVFEGVPLLQLTTSAAFLMGRLEAIGLPALVIAKEVAPEHLENFVRFLHETKDEGLSPAEIQARLARFGAHHIRVKEAEESDEDDLILARDIYDNAVSVVISVLHDIRLGKIPSGAESERVVRDMSSMLKRNRDAMLALTLIKNFDEYTYNHSVNVAVLSLALADSLKLTEQQKIDVGIAGLLHDVGKTQLALALIRKPGPLSAEEFEEIKKHPDEGFVLLGKMSHIRPDSAYLVREHHMRFDLSGYPRPAAGFKPHPYTGLIPVADCYDALTTMRSYQKAKTPLEALQIMGKIAGKSLDPEMVSAFSRVLGAYPVGTMVRLDTMEVGVVRAAGSRGAGPLTVVVLFDRNGTPLIRPEEVIVSAHEAGGGRPRRFIVGTVNPHLFPYTPSAAVIAAQA